MSFFTTADCASASRVTLCSRPWETRLQARLQSTLRSYMFSGAPSELGRHRNWPRHRSRRNSLPTPLAAPGARGEGHIASGATASHARRLRQPRQSTPRSPRTFRVAPRRARSAPKAASLNAPAPPARGMWAHDRDVGRSDIAVSQQCSPMGSRLAMAAEVAANVSLHFPPAHFVQSGDAA